VYRGVLEHEWFISKDIVTGALLIQMAWVRHDIITTKVLLHTTYKQNSFFYLTSKLRKFTLCT
jgi:hypothetical protein